MLGENTVAGKTYVLHFEPRNSKTERPWRRRGSTVLAGLQLVAPAVVALRSPEADYDIMKYREMVVWTRGEEKGGRR